MLVFVLLLCAVASEPIPFSGERDQLFPSSADLIASFRNEKPTAPELPAVIPFSSDAPSKRETALHSNTDSDTPPHPVLNRSMHLRVELLLPDLTRSFEVEYHAESNTARTTVENSSIIYRNPDGQGHIQFLKVEIDTTGGTPVRHCTKSPSLPVSPADNAIPGLPNLEPFKFEGYKTEEGRLVEHWQNLLVGKPGDYGAARGEALNYTHDFYVYREGEDAVPIRYKVTTDSSVLGAGSDTYTHRYTVLPPPTAPLMPDVTLCDDVQEYQDGRRRRAISLSREEFIWLINANKEKVIENNNNDFKQKLPEIVWSY
ncbi:uncharacterized protein LOC125237816 isoform X2 [Leguminivora glycinivorella]|uniref:uncharacterized protein LOC125237816 isoform X2 n=1 Tax=Leguminivora glycinivorella TaxID=1035111 RepID=UPI00200D4AEF|nr:uncharacterized protein LOC125237816 isoform X2 [Leguminivora glycinivorella]